MNNYDEIYEYLTDWAERTERIVGAALKKQKVVLSNPSEKNIVIAVFKKSLTNIGITISTRDALRFVDMGAGRGWRKGKRITQREYRKKLDEVAKPRVRKAVFNKPIFRQIARLKDVVASSITESMLKDLPK